MISKNYLSYDPMKPRNSFLKMAFPLDVWINLSKFGSMREFPYKDSFSVLTASSHQSCTELKGTADIFATKINVLSAPTGSIWIKDTTRAELLSFDCESLFTKTLPAKANPALCSEWFNAQNGITRDKLRDLYPTSVLIYDYTMSK